MPMNLPDDVADRAVLADPAARAGLESLVPVFRSHGLQPVITLVVATAVDVEDGTANLHGDGNCAAFSTTFELEDADCPEGRRVRESAATCCYAILQDFVRELGYKSVGDWFRRRGQHKQVFQRVAADGEAKA